MKFFSLYIIIFLSLVGIFSTARADEFRPDLKYNPHSIHPIPESELFLRRRVWREIDLRQGPNKAFFLHNREITKLIIEGVKQGLLTPYADEDFNVILSKENFLEKLRSTHSAEAAYEFLPSDVSILELMEDLLFDKIRSKMVYDIQSIKLIIPAEYFDTGLRREVALFQYKQLVAYFNSLPEECVWVNVKNTVENLTWTQAFELRQFRSRIIKVDNLDGTTVDDHNPKESIRASQALEKELLELEYFLWEP